MAVLQIKVHDWEARRPLCEAASKRIGAHQVDAREGEHAAVRHFQGGIWRAHFACSDVCLSHEAHGGIEEQIALCLTGADEESDIVLGVLAAESAEVGIAENIYVME